MKNNNTDNKKYNKSNLENLYLKPKAYLFIPIIGFAIYMIRMNKYSKEAGLYDLSTPGAVYMKKLTNLFFIFTNIFIIPWSLFVAIAFNFMFWFWRAKTLKALEMNKDSY